MKGVTSKVTGALTIGSYVKVDDNSGAKEVMIIGVLGKKGVRGRNLRAGVGDIVVCAVKKGKPEMVKKVVKAVIIRQKMPYKRPNGLTVRFEDNAVALVTDDFVPVGTEIKGVVAKEVAERFPKVAAIGVGLI